jgi:long-chain acyl-CoA synthetase
MFVAFVAHLSNHWISGYGLTETTASATIMTLDDRSVGRVGAPMDGVYIRLVDWTEGGYGIKDLPFPRGVYFQVF